MPVAETPITRLRDRLGPAFSDAVSGHRPQFIERNGREHGLLLGYEEACRLVEPHEFHPEVLFEEDAVSIWLPEFTLYGRGSDLDEATEDLLDEVRAYVEEYLAETELFLRAPNRSHHFPWVLKAALADLGGRLQQVLLAEPRQPVPATA
jgi:antitoxin YefM